MLDFLKICAKRNKDVIEITPKFIVGRVNDLMIRGGDFYAIWNDETKLWSTDPYEAIRLIDDELRKYYKENANAYDGMTVKAMYLWDSDTGSINKWHKYVHEQMDDLYEQLDQRIVFSNTQTTQKDYISKKLPYPLEKGSITAYDQLISTLYSEEERRKIEWAIGSIVAGDSKNIQKFLVFYGSAGTGKSTIINVIQKLFEGYWRVFDSQALASRNDSFALEPFESNPLVAIQHDGDLSHIETNTRLNSLVSHETMSVNAKFKSLYSMRFNAFLFMGTNRPVKITDAKSGLLRRLIDVTPTGEKIPIREYERLVKQVDFELGAIASHCLEVYKKNPDFYKDYIPIRMMDSSNDFFNFVLDNRDIFENDDPMSLKRAWTMYKEYAEESRIPFPMSMRVFKEELKSYYYKYCERLKIEGVNHYSMYCGFKTSMLEQKPSEENTEETVKSTLIFEKQSSLLDEELCFCKAQYGTQDGIPEKRWDNCNTVLSDLDTSKLHYVIPPDNHIVIDFDIKDEDGNKSFALNAAAAEKWPATYAELSKSGAGIHLHYIYDGDVTKLARLYDEDIEIKVFTGKSSLRRKLTMCNDIPIATIKSGLPLRKEDKMVNFENVKNEKALRTLIRKNLNKEIHPGTKPSIDFIATILDGAYESGMHYDVTDLEPAIMTFATNSTNHPEYCMKVALKMKYKSEEPSEAVEYDSDELIFYDVEVFPNLFVVVWKAPGKPPVKMINPSASDIEVLVKHKLVGFNCRRYDNHILYARLLGYSNERLYKISQNIINKKKGDTTGFFKEAYNLSYTDIYDYAAKKQSLKKWEIQLGIHHLELGLPWDQPVDESMWTTVADYCVNDVVATEAVWNATQGDWIARQILADVAGGSVNDTTNSLTTKIIFGRERHPSLVYTDLATGKQDPASASRTDIINAFPGYFYESKSKSEDGNKHNWFRGVDLGFGGYVYANPGMYGRTITLDVRSQHPNSILAMNCFGDFTPKFEELVNARAAIKHKDFDAARKMLDGKLAKYLEDESQAENLSTALKIAINSVYGLTAANFDNPFRDPRNENNIVALRGALFMKTLQDEIEARGFRVAHIKTDSIKIVEPTNDILDYAMDFAKKYGYEFEIEHIFEKICLVNDAVYIAKLAEDDPKKPGQWTATGTQFAVPYVFKTLFSKEPLIFKDLCETKTVETSIYLDMNEGLGEDEHAYRFVGKAGQFCPIKDGCGGGVLLREKDGKYSAVVGTKGYKWLESEVVKELDKQNDIDISYYEELCTDAIETIEQFGDFEQFASN